MLETKQKLKDKFNFFFPKRKPGLIEYIAVLLCLVMLVSTFTYSWIKRNWTPQISQDGIRIVAGDSLVFSLIGKGHGSTEALTLWEVEGTSIDLSPVSNLSGESDDFFKIDSTNQNAETFVHLYPAGSATASAWQQLGEENGYIELTFVIQGRDVEEQGTDYTKYVFLTTDSKIKASSNQTSELKEVYKAIRCSISFDDTTVLFVPTVSGEARTHKAINNETVTVNNQLVWTADGAAFNGINGSSGVSLDSLTNRYRKYTYEYGGVTKSLVLTNNDVYTFEDKMGGYLTNGTGSFDSQKALFSLTPGDSKTVTVRIWLEGEDAACGESIKGSQIDFLLGFESENVTNSSGENDPSNPFDE